MTSTKWHTSMSLAEVEDDLCPLYWYHWALSIATLGLCVALFGLLAWGAYWLGKHWRVW
jgi:hypothetical protein